MSVAPVAGAPAERQQRRHGGHPRPGFRGGPARGGPPADDLLGAGDLGRLEGGAVDGDQLGQRPLGRVGIAGRDVDGAQRASGGERDGAGCRRAHRTRLRLLQRGGGQRCPRQLVLAGGPQRAVEPGWPVATPVSPPAAWPPPRVPRRRRGRTTISAAIPSRTCSLRRVHCSGAAANPRPAGSGGHQQPFPTMAHKIP